ncbi:hypothetical protein F5878DRAFT_141290 [Lentinula raphanica]|uniref:DUF5648 domain-containing protein n=1 Tax=Lentinula raphanica TaxID=153919 RepID=A0AA38UFD6_9AGAR|nr:hypothetical protein F5878DRAFT_141290 [Lentinula raphanica]
MSFLFLTFVHLLSCLTLATVRAADSSECADTSSLVPLLRAFSSSLQDHFYTTNASEMNNNALVGGVYAFEGEAAFIWSSSQPGTIPLFRLYNRNATDHFYTMSSDEVPEMMLFGWANDTGAPDQIAGYVYPYSICGASPIYRLFNPTAMDHFYTMDDVESQSAVAAGYQAQGIAGYAMLPSPNGTVEKESAVPYVLPSTVTASPESQSTAASSSCANVANAVPLLRAYTLSGSDHFYTTNSTEMSNALAASYSFEGDAAFVWSTQETSTVPLYRMFSQNSNDHFYTIDANETSEALSLGYAFESDSHIAGYVYPYSVCGASPIYRLYSSSGGDHFYTMSRTEGSAAPGYVLEGIAGFALLPSPDGQRQTVTVSASPFLLPVSLEPSPVSLPSTFIAAFSTSINDVNPTSTSTTSNSGSRAVRQISIVDYGFLVHILMYGLIALCMGF